MNLRKSHLFTERSIIYLYIFYFKYSYSARSDTQLNSAARSGRSKSAPIRHFHPVSRLRMCGAVLSFPIYGQIAWCSNPTTFFFRYLLAKHTNRKMLPCYPNPSTLQFICRGCMRYLLTCSGCVNMRFQISGLYSSTNISYHLPYFLNAL